MELTPDEVETVTTHIRKMHDDPEYKSECIQNTVNPDTNAPEIANLRLLKLKDLAEGRHRLLNADQISLFRKLNDFTNRYGPCVQPRKSAPASYTGKMHDLETLSEHIDTLRRQGNPVIGITSGVFDILHPGHFSFLEDARANCDHLIVIIASDRTTSEQKGPEKPFVNEHKRASNIASISMTDSVIISDELYHERLLRAIGPDILFKGDDYAGKEIIGSDLVGRVVLIPCAEKQFFSSSEFARRIKNGDKDEPPPWAADKFPEQ